MIKWDRIAALPANGAFVTDAKKYGSPLVAHLQENKAHLEMLVAEDEQGFGYYRRVRVVSASGKVRWSRSDYTAGARLKDFLNAENTRQVLLNRL